MKTKRVFILLTGLLMMALVVLGTGCSNNSSSDQKVSDQKVSGIVPIFTPGAGGIQYILNAGICNLFNTSKVMPDIQLVTEAGGSTPEILSLVLDKTKQGKPALGAVAYPDAANLYNGAYEKIPGKHPDIRAVASVGGSAIHVVVRADSTIKSFSDLKGKSIGVSPGSPMEDFLKEVLQIYGLKSGDYKFLPLSYQEVQQGLQNSSVDAGVLMGAIPAALAKETAQTIDVRFLSIGDAELEKVKKEVPLFDTITVKASTYKGQDTVVTMGALTSVIFTNKNTPDEVIYNYIKVILENREGFEAIHPVAKQITEKNIAIGIDIPFHPGAEKYYKEKGIMK